MKGSGGQSLILTLLALLVVLALGTMFILYVGRDIDFVTRMEGTAAAEYLALSGAEYALYNLNHADWLDRKRPFSYEGTLASGRFKVTISGKSTIEVLSEGISKSGVRRKYLARVSNPADITSYVLCIGSYNMESGKRRNATTVLGADGVAAGSIVEELYCVPKGTSVSVGAINDSYYAGIVPGSDYVIDSRGVELTRETVGPSQAGRYIIDYVSGKLVFHATDVGRDVCVFYDYFRRVPVAPSPLAVRLAGVQLRENSEQVWSYDGRPFWRSAVFPNAQANYYIDYLNAVVRLSEFDSGRPLRISYSFLGSRITGPVHINGDVEWHKTNRLFVFRKRGDEVSATGRFRYASGARVDVLTEQGYMPDVQRAEYDSSLYREGVEPTAMPSFDLKWMRKQADPRSGGSGWYIDNTQDTEKLLLRDQPTRESERNQLLYALWQVRHGAYWSPGAFRPPGVLLDLSKLTEQQARNGLILAEGNIRVKGRIPKGRKLTVVSASNIYIEGSIWKGAPSSALALIAEGNICINLSQISPIGNTNSPVDLYLNALLVARKGTLAVIPGGGQSNEAVIYGAVYVNHTYSNAEWADAFSSVHYIYDPSFSSSDGRPPCLATQLDIRRAF